MASPLNPRVSSQHWALALAFEEQNLSHRPSSRGFYVSMLDRDLSNLHFAYEMHLEYDGIEYDEGDRLVNNLLQELGGHQGHQRTTSLFSELVSTVASDHLLYGRCVFELFKNQKEKDLGPHLAVLPGWSLRQRLGSTYQANPIGRKIRWHKLPKAALVEFGLPGKMGKELYRASRRLQILDPYRPDHSEVSAKLRSAGSSYNRKMHQDSLDELTALAAKPIGWDGRDLFLSRATNSYRRYRELQFRRTWLTIVAATAETLNRICNDPALNAGNAMELRVSGLPNINDVNRSMAGVISGSDSLDKIFKEILHPRHA